MIERTVITGGRDAWQAGYFGIEPMLGSLCTYDEWYWESFLDGAAHRREDDLSKQYRQEAIERMKALRAKFKAIKAKR